MWGEEVDTRILLKKVLLLSLIPNVSLTFAEASASGTRSSLMVLLGQKSLLAHNQLGGCHSRHHLSLMRVYLASHHQAVTHGNRSPPCGYYEEYQVIMWWMWQTPVAHQVLQDPLQHGFVCNAVKYNVPQKYRHKSSQKTKPSTNMTSRHEIYGLGIQLKKHSDI
jgi:hypothetical protein